MTEQREDNIEINYIDTLPMELMYKIFSNLCVKDKIKCRRLSVQWKSIIDGIVGNDSFWEKSCEKDFENCYKTAKYKAKSKLSWYNLYKCLSLWPHLELATEAYNNFATASGVSEEVLNVVVLKNGVLGVHTKTTIDYYDSDTLNLSLKNPIKGNYSYYMENDNAIVIKSYHLHLIVLRKILNKKLQRTFDNIKLSLITDNLIYLVEVTDDIYVCDISSNQITYEFLAHLDDGVMCMGYDNGILHLLTFKRNIYTIDKNKNVVLKQSLDSEQNLLNVMFKYKFLELLDWRVYFQWMFVSNHSIPEGPIAYISTVKPYGDIFFVGTQFGQVFIYYKPFTNGEFDIFNSRPIYQLDLLDTSLFCVSHNVILQIDALETETGHTVFVATPKKIGIFKFTYNFLCYQMWEMGKGFVAD